ncbi:hypothetical protein J7E73_21555 [Paenibacillus albidus]|uniref:stalk domain-containing protein n=1 Tax=Paenibacillus albidus TaxID=2041023 RepID=UPI001BE75016|nr:stalk domain-containing protein [Paenibacillus albidus]MBT2291666.1 hypothetical protein [Paenibacillus albidus]
MSAYVKKMISLILCSVLLLSAAPMPAGAAISPAKLSGIKEIVASGGFWGGNSFALGKDGSVWVWGSNVFGQFANGTAGPEGWIITPHRLSVLDHTKQLVVGRGGVYAALKEDGTVTVWGGFEKKPKTVPDSDEQIEVLPMQTVSGLTHVTRINATIDGFLALKQDGSLVQWKVPAGSGQGYTEYPAAEKTPILTEVAMFSSGFFNAAVRKNGTLWLWRQESSTFNTGLSVTPAPVSNLYHVQTIAQNENNLLALTKDGKVWASVRNPDRSNKVVLKKMEGLSNIVTIQTGNGVNLVQNSKGEYWFWKSGTQLQYLQKVTGISGISRLTLDLGGFTAVKNDGTVWTWQQKYVSEDTWGVTPPKIVKGLLNPVLFATGENSKYAVLKDGTAVAWGTNMFGQLGISALDSRPFKVSPILKPVTLVINGKVIQSEQSAIYTEGNVMIPLREVAQALGYTVSWDGMNTILAKQGKSVMLKEGQFISDGGKGSIAVRPPAIQVSYTLLVPAGALAQALGITAKWESNLYRLTLTTQK